MIKLFIIIVSVSLLFSKTSYSQSLSLNTDGTLADSSAVLDIKSTTKGILIPRMTLAQRDSIFMPATSVIIYQTDSIPGFYFFNGSRWEYFVTRKSGSSPNTLIYLTRGFK